MKFCGNCGQQLDDNATFCTYCNAVIGEPAAYQYPVQQPVQQPVQPQPPVYIPEPSAAPYGAAPAANDDPYPINVTHKGFWALGFFLEFVGLIMYFVFKNSKPRLAKSALKGFITGLIVWGSVGVIIGLLSCLPMIVMMFEELL